MKMIAIERSVLGIGAGQFTSEILRAEANAAWQLHTLDIIRELYFGAETHQAVLVLECGSVEEARRNLASLPLVECGMIAFEIIPLTPYSGFSRLFARQGGSNS